MPPEDGATAAGGGPDTSTISNVNTTVNPGEGVQTTLQPFTTPPANQGVDFSSIVPDEFKSKLYMQGIDTPDKLFKQFDNMQSMIGKKPQGIPQENASEDEWNTFYNNLGRPETPDKYEFTDVPEGLSRNEKEAMAVKELFHKAGLTGKQAKMLQQGYEGMVAQQLKEIDAEEDKAFDELATQTFGQEKQKVIDLTRDMIKQHCPQNFADHMASLDNKTLVALAGFVKNVHDKFVSEDGPIGTKGGTGAAVDTTSLREEARALMAQPAWSDQFHKDHVKTKQRVNDLYSQIGQQTK